ncbi:MAG: hypothetical protein H6557_08260 [Lewinellaceae bacterium]|nr:hypothetical protein [Lewinellaceae bacterium]
MPRNIRGYKLESHPLDFVLGLGYRYQPASGSFFAAAGLFPYLHLDPTPAELSEEQAKLRLRLGLSVGWYFRR